jgi:hypothetical protein
MRWRVLIGPYLQILIVIHFMNDTFLASSQTIIGVRKALLMVIFDLFTNCVKHCSFTACSNFSCQTTSVAISEIAYSPWHMGSCFHKSEMWAKTFHRCQVWHTSSESYFDFGESFFSVSILIFLFLGIDRGLDVQRQSLGTQLEPFVGTGPTILFPPLHKILGWPLHLIALL